MSLLLRGEGKDGRGGQTNRLLPNMKRRVLATGMPRFTTTAVCNGNRNTFTGALQGDDQIMLQRKIVSPIPSQQPVSDQKHRQQNSQSIGQKHCVVSMEEVMNDLRLLEEQQREAQRKVAIMKLNKQQKEEQLHKLEQSLASLQYTNAQQREQLERCRQLMSVQTRELGAVKLRSCKATSNLKRFDDKLRNGLQVMHALSRQQRAMETKLVQLENCSRILDRLKFEAEKKLQTAKENLNALEHKESLLMKTTQSSKNDARALSDDINKVRSCSNDLEEDLRIASQMETRTKVNLEMKAAEIESEEKRHGLVIGEKQGLLQACFVRRDELQANIMKKKEVFEERRMLLLQMKETAESIKHDLFSTSEGKQSKIDTHNMELQLEKEKKIIAEEFLRQDCLKLGIDSMKDEVHETEGKTNANVQIAEARKREIEADFYNEKERTTSYDSVCLEVEEQRSDVNRLHLIVAETTEELQKVQDKALSELAHLTDTLADAKEQTRVLSSTLRDEIALTEVAKTVHDTILRQISIDNQHMKEKTHEVQNRLRGAQDNVSHLVENPDDNNDELLQIDEGHKILLRCTTDESSKLVTEYPSLGELDFTFDLEKEEVVQIELALADLACKCNERLHVAKEDWQIRHDLAQQEHFEAIRKSEEEECQKREREEKRRQDEQEQHHNWATEGKGEKEEEVQRQNREREVIRRREVEVKRRNRDRKNRCLQEELNKQCHYNGRAEKHLQQKAEQRRPCEGEEKHRREEEGPRRHGETEKCGQDKEVKLRHRKDLEKKPRCKEGQRQQREGGEKGKKKQGKRHRSVGSRQNDTERSPVDEVKETPEEKKCNGSQNHEERARQNEKGKLQQFKSGERRKQDKDEQSQSDPTQQNHHLHQKTNEKPMSIHCAEMVPKVTKRKVYFRDTDNSDEVEYSKKRRKGNESIAVSTKDVKESSSISVEERNKSDCELLPHEFMHRAKNRTKHKSNEESAPCKTNLLGSPSPTSSKHGLIDQRAPIAGTHYDVSVTKPAVGKAKSNKGTRGKSKAIVRSTTEQSSIDAAPLVEAALTAASQESVRVSQTSAYFRSRHKRSLLSSLQKSKIQDPFLSSDEGFLHSRSNSEKKKSSKSAVISSISKHKRCSDDNLKSRSSISLASSFHVPNELPNQHKIMATVRVRRRKLSLKGTSQSSIEEDFGFL